MITTPAATIAGHRTVETLGLVRGNTIRARHLGKDILAGLKNLVGGEIEEYTGLVQKMAAAHQKHEKGLRWVGYMNMIGGKGTQIFYFLGMDKLGEMDGWPEGKEVMVAAYGEEGASEIYNKMVKIAQGKSKILKFVPGFSRFEVPEE